VLNLITFTIVAYWLRKYVVRAVSREPFLTLGKASLQVFCAHMFFVFVGLALLYGEVEQLHGITAVALLTVTFLALILVAVNEVRKGRTEREQRRKEENIQAAEDRRGAVLGPPANGSPLSCAEHRS
jgi:membrane protein implicated in regulation of membrane protease activity